MAEELERQAAEAAAAEAAAAAAAEKAAAEGQAGAQWWQFIFLIEHFPDKRGREALFLRWDFCWRHNSTYLAHLLNMGLHCASFCFNILRSHAPKAQDVFPSDVLGRVALGYLLCQTSCTGRSEG